MKRALVALLWVVMTPVGCSDEQPSVPDNPTAAGRDVPTAAVSPTAAPTASANVSAKATATPTPLPSVTHTPEPQPDQEVVLLPTGDWEVRYFYSQVERPFDADNQHAAAARGIRAATDAGIFGPVIRAYVVRDADYRRIGNPGGPYFDTSTSNGVTVRVRTDLAPLSLTAVYQAGADSVVAIAYDVVEADLMTVVENIEIVNGLVTLSDRSALPLDLKLFEYENNQTMLSVYTLRRSETDALDVTVLHADDWQFGLLARASHPEGQLTEVAGNPALVYATGSRGDAGAVFIANDQLYVLSSTDVFSIDEMSAIVSSIAEVPVAPIMDRLGLEPRSDVYAEWITRTPLPAEIDLDWLAAGPAVDPTQEAFRAHQIFQCEWAQVWVQTGDLTALDQIEAHHGWPTADLLRLQLGIDGSWASPMANSVEEARELATVEERERSHLRYDCGFALGPVPT